MNLKYPDDYIDKIICGDCPEVMKGIPDGAVDLVLTDPPYGVTKNKWDEPMRQEWLDECLRIGKSVIVFSGAIPWNVKHILSLTPLPDRICVWYHTFTLTNSNGSFWNWQPFYIYGKKAQNIDTDVLVYNTSDNCGKLHPTQKPESLMAHIVSRVTSISNLILDPFLGSGTTAVACRQLNRRFIGIEINPDYCKIARERLMGTPESLFKEQNV